MSVSQNPWEVPCLCCSVSFKSLDVDNAPVWVLCSTSSWTSLVIFYTSLMNFFLSVGSPINIRFVSCWRRLIQSVSVTKFSSTLHLENLFARIITLLNFYPLKMFNWSCFQLVISVVNFWKIIYGLMNFWVNTGHIVIQFRPSHSHRISVIFTFVLSTFWWFLCLLWSLSVG